MAKLYNHYRSEAFDCQVGHISSDGVVYNHWQSESLTYAIGHVRGGVVYNHWSSDSYTYAIGHVNNKGVIYNHRDSESLTYAIGHVDSNGVVYDHWESESLSHAIGHVCGGGVFAAGAAFLLLHASFNGPAVDHQPPVNEEEWRKERIEHEIEMERIRNRNKVKAAKMKNYKNNPQIAAAAREHAQQRAKNATVVTPIFFAVLCIGGFKNLTSEAIVPVIAIVGLFILVMTLFIRHKTYKDAFEKKVWELGEAGYGRETPAKKQTLKKAVPKTENESVQKPAPKPKQEQKPTPAPTPKPTPKPQPVETKISVCPHCGAKFHAPVGVGRIKITCPNPDCKEQFTLDT